MISETQKEQQNALHNRLWAIANDLRGNMEANEFKNYILGLIFYRYLSEKIEERANSLLKEDNITYLEAWQNEEFKEALKEELISQVGYVIEPEYLFSNIIKLIENGDFNIQMLSIAIKNITNSTIGAESEEEFINLFDDMDLESNKLGKSVKDRTALIQKVISNISEIDFHFNDTEIDVLGDAYEYLIGQFAANAGKKAGEFYTPQQVSKILAKIVTLGKDKLKNVYDPTCGSGSLLLRVAKELQNGDDIGVYHFYGQELTSTTYNLARMNMLLHNVPYKRFSIKNDDTLEHPHFNDMYFEAIVANPPYSANWSADSKFLDDERFSAYGKLAPKSKADYAFIQHMIYHLDEKGIMAVVLPHGVLFRGASEGVIRKYLIKEKNYLDTVIGLPANIFYGTSIPTVILVFKKCRENPNDILFIDASKDFEKGKNQNILRDEDVNKIFEHYKNRKSVDKYSYVAPMSEIEENEYNLNIPRYVDTFEEEEEINLDQVMNDIKSNYKEQQLLNEQINVYLRELGLQEF